MPLISAFSIAGILSLNGLNGNDLICFCLISNQTGGIVKIPLQKRCLFVAPPIIDLMFIVTFIVSIYYFDIENCLITVFSVGRR